MENCANGNSAGDAMAAAAHTGTEKTLLQIWSDVLNKGDIGIHDDFLGLGGDSMAAMRCMNRISAAFGVELPIDLFLIESADIAVVAAAIAGMKSDPARIVVPENS
jgi:acyl carrier protein